MCHVTVECVKVPHFFSPARRPPTTTFSLFSRAQQRRPCPRSHPCNAQRQPCSPPHPNANPPHPASHSVGTNFPKGTHPLISHTTTLTELVDDMANINGQRASPPAATTLYRHYLTSAISIPRAQRAMPTGMRSASHLPSHWCDTHGMSSCTVYQY